MISSGQTIAGKYRINQLLGSGGMASVWSATNIFTEREFAIKFMLPAVAHFSPAPLGLVEANGFASLHSIAGEGKSWTYRTLINTTPDWLDNVKAVAQIHTPILVIVSDTDTRVPMHNGLSIFAAAPEPKTLITLHGFQHNDLYKTPTDAWWQPTLTFITAPNQPQPPAPSTPPTPEPAPTSEPTPEPAAAP